MDSPKLMTLDRFDGPTGLDRTMLLCERVGYFPAYAVSVLGCFLSFPIFLLSFFPLESLLWVFRLILLDLKNRIHRRSKIEVDLFSASLDSSILSFGLLISARPIL